mgnify:CR=1 FL=1
MQTEINFEEGVDAILAKDNRYTREAYFFVRESLDVAQKRFAKAGGKSAKDKRAHVSGQQLLEAIRAHALEQFGPLTLMVLEKKKEIAILRAMGAQGSEVAAVFLSEGIFIGTIGLGGGILLAFILCSVLKRYEFIQLPEIYYDRTLPVVFETWIYVGVAICAFLIVLAACIYPSRRASRVSPLDGIRFG